MHTQPKFNKPFEKGRLDLAPSGIHICNDYWYDEAGKKRFIPNRRKRRDLAKNQGKPKRTNNRKHTRGRVVQVVKRRQIAHSY